MRVSASLKICLRASALSLALTTVAWAQGPGGGGPGGGGGHGGPGAGGGFGDRFGGGPGNAVPGIGRPGYGHGGGGVSAPDGLDRPVPGDDAPPGLDAYTRGPEGALEAVQANQALPLDSIVAAARHLTDGEIIDAQLNAVNGALRYDLKVLEASGEVRRYSFDARTAQLAEVR